MKRPKARQIKKWQRRHHDEVRKAMRRARSRHDSSWSSVCLNEIQTLGEQLGLYYGW